MSTGSSNPMTPSIIPSSPDLSDTHRSGLEHWVDQKTSSDRGTVRLEIQPKEFRQLQDRIRNRDFERMSGKVQAIGLGSMAHGLMEPEWDLRRFSAVYDVEPMVRKSVNRQVNLWFKKGIDLVGPDPRIARYLARRLREIAYVTGIPTVRLLRTVAYSLYKYSNAFLLKVRSRSMSTGIAGVHGEGVAPVAGYIPISPMTIRPVFEDGKLTKWRRFRIVRNGRLNQYQDIAPRDIVHFTFDREEDFLYGKPRLLGVIEDIAALRRIEEAIEILIARYLFPIYQFKIGTKERPPVYLNDGRSEIEAAWDLIYRLSEEGTLVIPYRYNLEVVDHKGGMLDVSKYLEHFKARVLAGLGVSKLDMGESGSGTRSDADNISQNLKDLVLEDQTDFNAQVQIGIFAELIAESERGWSAPLNFDQVRLVFSDVDIDNEIKKQNHVVNLWNNHVITHDEARAGIDRNPMVEQDWDDTRYGRIDRELALIGSVDESSGLGATNPTGSKGSTGGSTQAKVSGGKRKTGTKKDPGKATTKAKSQPSNQHGTNPGPTARKSSLELDPAFSDFLARVPHCTDSEAWSDAFEDVPGFLRGPVQHALKRAFALSDSTETLCSALHLELLSLQELLHDC